MQPVANRAMAVLGGFSSQQTRIAGLNREAVTSLTRHSKHTFPTPTFPSPSQNQQPLSTFSLTRIDKDSAS
jgi:hypothetical protein